MILRARGLGVSVDGVTLFDGLDLDLAAGERLVVHGPNGTGKSTLLRCLHGTQQPTDGAVTVFGEPPDERSAAFRRRVSVVLDDSALFDEFSPRQHFDLLLRSFPGAGPPADDVFAGSGLEERVDVPAGALSTGQRRRLLLLAAVTRPHDVLLLDEPERALDTDGRAWLAELLRRSEAAVVAATHDAGLTEHVADHLLDLG